MSLLRRRWCLVALITLLTPSRAHAGQACSISVNFSSPRSNDVVGNTLSINVTVSSVCQLQTVVATMPGQSAPLTFDAVSHYWKADVPINAVPFGGFTLTVTATDIFGTAGSASVPLVHDTPPTVIVTAPDNQALARPVIHVTATCQDDDPAGCVSLRVLVGTAFPDTVAAGTSSIDQDVSLAGYGNIARVSIAGRDSRGESTIVTRFIYVEPSPRLVETFRAPGLVLDDASSRNLFTNDSGEVCLLDKSSGVTTVLLTGQFNVLSGVLTPLGALFVSAASSSDPRHVYEWRNGTLLDLGRPDSRLTYRLNGVYAIWFGTLTGSATRTLYVRDAAAGSTLAVDSQATGVGDAAANGDVVYPGLNGQIWRYRSGARTPISAAGLGAVAPVSDGTNVAYQRQGSNSYSTWLITTAGEIALDPGGAGTASAGVDYAVANAWTAFTKQSPDGSRNVWIRRPDGTQSQVTFFGDAVEIAALNDDGRLAVRSRGRTYLITPGSPAVDVGSAWPAFWRSGELFLMVGRSVLQVQMVVPAKYIGDFDGDARADMTRFSSGSWRTKTSLSAYSSTSTTILGGDGDTPVAGDFDGDGRQDPAIYRASTGTWTAVLSGSPGAPPFTIHLGGPTYVAVPGDYDADGKTDPAVYQRTSGWWFVLKSSSGYVDSIAVNWGGAGYTAIGGQDFDGDGKADLGAYRRATGTWYILKSSTNYTTTIAMALGGAGFSLVPGDYDGDGKADIAVYERATGWWSVWKSSTGYTDWFAVNWGGAGYVPVPGDYDGDRKMDPAIFLPATGNWHVLKSSSGYISSFTIADVLAGAAPVTSAIAVGGNDILRATDLDDDGASEVIVYNPATSYWYTLTSTSDYTTAINRSWGGTGYTPVPGDFDGDGMTDLGVYQETSGYWYVLLSGAGFTTSVARNLGGPGWTPVPGDYDSDGKTDFVAYNRSTGQWYGLLSRTNYATTVNVMRGGAGFVAVPGDYDGDGRADIAVYESATGAWSVLLAASNYANGLSTTVGGAGYIPVQGDYDGDGKTDFVVYDTSTGQWYGLKSGANYSTSLNVNWGGSGYTPVKGDYDGDGRTDLAVYQASSGTWSVLLSGANYTTTLSRNWGGVGYNPVAVYP